MRERIATIFARQDCDSLVVLFASEGGGTVDGLALYNFLQSLPRPIHFHAVGNIGSIAIPVFCGAQKRTCAKISRFSFHTYDWRFSGRQTLVRILEASQRLKDDIEISRKIVESRTRIPAKRLAELYRDTATPTIFSPEEAKQFGLVEDIIEINSSGATLKNTVIWTVDWPSS